MKLREEWKWIVPIIAVCVIVFFNSLSGEFVYDDLRQILRNTLIQDNSLVWKALTSDVWAFKGDGTVAASNYWRPTFTAWNILCFRLFGTSPFGWHLCNLLLHLCVCLLSYLLLRKWAFSTTVAFIIALIFAVHPVHVESVSWIAGSPDLLFSAAFLGSLWFAQNYVERGKVRDLVLTIILYALALGAKEIGILCLPIYYLVFTTNENTLEKKSRPSPTEPIVILMATAAAYFFIRLKILGAISLPPDDPTPIWAAFLSIPEMFVFYLRQIFFPYWIAAGYGMDPVSQPGIANFWAPLLVTLAAIAAIVYLAQRSRRGALAAALFAMPLLPALNGTAFNMEHLVHDRYLYLPLLGALMLIVPLCVKFIGERRALFAATAVSIILSVQTVLWSFAWTNDLNLWAWTTRVDNGPFASTQYGAALSEKKRFDEAITAFTNSLNQRSSSRALLGRGRAYIGKKSYSPAEADLREILKLPPERQEAYMLYQTYEALGIVLSETRAYDAAARALIEGRSKLPIYSAALTEKLAIVLYQAGKKDEALRELEAAKSRARVELLPESKAVFLRIGMLYSEMGRKDDARTALREYLGLTAGIHDEKTVEDRHSAANLLGSLK